MYLSLLVLFVETLLITLLNYAMAGTYISFDVLYCLPILQAARTKAVLAHRSSDSPLPFIIGTIVAVIWSFAEAWVTADPFPLYPFLLNIFTRGLTLGVLGKIVSHLWKSREYSHKDSLTNLANRVELMERLEYTQLVSERSGKPYSLLYIDVDQFKQLNDNFGHRVGDDALCEVASILKSSSRDTDIIARIGGDEFVVLLPDTEAEACEIMRKRIQRSSEYEFDNRQWDISLSIGQATSTGKEKSPLTMLDEADANMYASKKSKKNQ